ncbi:hypothetical protein EJ04DRAFT_391350, partial [Polyplosphaeria fusca]
LTSTCLCTAITVTINDTELFTRRRGHLCHCTNCRKVAGSYVSSNLLLPHTSTEISDPQSTLKMYEDYATGSGNKVERYFCGVCGCPIMSKPAILPGKVIVKMGIFERIPAPEMECFVGGRQGWEGVVGGVVRYRGRMGGEEV